MGQRSAILASQLASSLAAIAAIAIACEYNKEHQF